MTIGIYKLEFSTSFYIGQSVNIERRYLNHKWMLNKNIHPNKKMQAIFNDTKILPKLIILEQCCISDLNKLEFYYINNLNALVIGLNCINDCIYNKVGQDHPVAVYTNNQIIAIFNDIISEKYSLKEISRKHIVHYSLVASISRGANHTWLSELYPEEYKRMVSTIRNNGNTAKNQGISYPLIKSPSGETFNVTNLSEFARLHNINKSSLCQLLNGKRKSANKYKLA